MYYYDYFINYYDNVFYILVCPPPPQIAQNPKHPNLLNRRKPELPILNNQNKTSPLALGYKAFISHTSASPVPNVYPYNDLRHYMVYDIWHGSCFLLFVLQSSCYFCSSTISYLMALLAANRYFILNVPLCLVR